MRLLGLAVLAIAVSPVWAQFGTAGAPPTLPGWSSPTGSFNRNPSVGRPFPGSRSNVIYLGQPWLDSYPPQSGQATYIVLQPPAPPSTAAKPVEESKPVKPLLIEWRGDRFVRMGADSLQAGPPADYAMAKRGENPPSAKPLEVAPAVLIYRDGHREQVQDYSIISGRLYTSADYFQSGSWMKAISLSALNLPATIEANHEAGVPFVLPSASNVVVTRF